MRKIRLNFDGLNSRDQVQDYMAKKLNFPSYYGRNLDALYDCLTEICEPVAIVCYLPNEEQESSYIDRVCQTIKDAEKDNDCLAVFFVRTV